MCFFWQIDLKELGEYCLFRYIRVLPARTLHSPFACGFGWSKKNYTPANQAIHKLTATSKGSIHQALNAICQIQSLKTLAKQGLFEG